MPVFFDAIYIRKKSRGGSNDHPRDFRKAAAAYSHTWWGTTIGASELNFSVRYGKRWTLAAITAAVCYLREIRRKEEKLALDKDIGLLVRVD